MEDKKYKFYKYENNPEGSDYCFCIKTLDLLYKSIVYQFILQ